MKLTTAQIKDLLLASKYIDRDKLTDAAKRADESHRSIVDILLFQGLATEDVVGEVLAHYYNVPVAKLEGKTIDETVANLIPENLARRYQMLPFEVHGRLLKLAMIDPNDLEAKQVASGSSRMEIVPYFILPQTIERLFSLYKSNTAKQFKAIVSEMAVKNVDNQALQLKDDQIIGLFDSMLAYGISQGASDVHIELAEKEALVRFRIDGLLNDVASLPQSVEPAIVARIKILSGLKLDEHRMPQDGRFKFEYSGVTVALRVSVLPAFYGENIVMRILSESARPLSFGELGLSGLNLEILERSIKKPHGMILVTGPTGSGKTTTLYSILNSLNSSTVKVCTLEDPVEYNIPRVTQSQINPTVGLTFASGLRSLLRHDPDIIMVGEIRDEETAEMAVHSALTGHLVLSSLHTNDAVGAIPRLLDMGAEPFLLASTVSVVIAQRLVRRICTNCITRAEVSSHVLDYLKKEFAFVEGQVQVYRGNGCSICHGSGYKGRVGIFEVIEVNRELEKLILTKTSGGELAQMAKAQGFKTMFNDGIDKATAGITTLEEVLRAIKE